MQITDLSLICTLYSTSHFMLIAHLQNCRLAKLQDSLKTVVLLCCTCKSHIRSVTESNKDVFHAVQLLITDSLQPICLSRRMLCCSFSSCYAAMYRHAHTHDMTWCAGLAAYACRSEAKKLANQALQKAWYRQSSKNQPFSKPGAWSRRGSETASAAHAIALPFQLSPF